MGIVKGNSLTGIPLLGAKIRSKMCSVENGYIVTDLEKYILEHTTPQDEVLEWLERETHLRTVHPRMMSAQPHGDFLAFIAKMMRPKAVLEIGTFTGYSALCLAKGLAQGGVLDTIEVNDEMQPLIEEAFHRAGFSHNGFQAAPQAPSQAPSQPAFQAFPQLSLQASPQPAPQALPQPAASSIFCNTHSDTAIQLHIGSALDILPTLTGKYDLVFIDGDKRQYKEYYLLVKPLLHKGSIIIADNVLWDGKVVGMSISDGKSSNKDILGKGFCGKDNHSAKIRSNDPQTLGIIEFNRFVQLDNSVSNFLLPLGDGLMVIEIL